jgi:hypothetical protein
MVIKEAGQSFSLFKTGGNEERLLQTNNLTEEKAGKLNSLILALAFVKTQLCVEPLIALTKIDRADASK